MDSLKAVLRNSTPALFDALLRIRRGRTVRVLSGALNRLALKRVSAGSKPFQIDVSSKMGFGATLSNAVVLLDHFEMLSGFRGVRSSNPLYSDPRVPGDLMELYFDRLTPKPGEACTVVKFRNPYDISVQPLGRGLTIERAHELFNLHFRIKAEFREQARTFHSEKLGNAIGVHFRGSDKRFEALRVNWDAITKVVDECLDSSMQDRVFVATDELEFMNHMRNRYGSRISALDCQHLSHGGIGAHFVGGSGFEKGREALLTILLLSMCKLCIRGPSHLSAWAKILNPTLPILMIGRPFEIEFPERAIVEASIDSASDILRAV
jgi:hypothetical protein